MPAILGFIHIPAYHEKVATRRSRIEPRLAERRQHPRLPPPCTDHALATATIFLSSGKRDHS